MKKLILPLFIISCVALFNCESEPVTGSEEVLVINDVELSIDTTYVFGDDFRAEGTVTYTGTESITPIWYLEGSFFRDASRSFKFGGDNTSFTFPLSRNQSTGWQLSFKNAQYPASRFPDFVVDELRVYKHDTSED